jgi:hypothetical protein
MKHVKKIVTALATLAAMQTAGAVNYQVISDAWFESHPAAHLDTTVEYVVQGTCYVRPGTTLTIDPGVVIRGIPGFGGMNPPTLIVCRDAKIFANGTAAKPIIMTTTTDDIANPYDLGPGARGLGGGLVVCGWSKIAENDLTDAAHFNGMTIEGIPNPTSLDKAGNTYAANGDADKLDEHDNSGSITYLSIRHGGTCPETGKEINGLSLYGVGDGTTIHHVETYGADDDGVECFGGTVNLKYIVNAYGNDDDLDLDDGYRGKVQFFFSIKNAQSSVFGTPDHGFEHSGLAKHPELTYYSMPQIYNWTDIGAGKTAVLAGANGDVSMMINQRMAGTYRNGIFLDWPKKAIKIDSAWVDDSKQRLLDGSLSIKKVFWWDIGAGSTWAAITSHQYEADSLAPYNFIKDPKIRGISRIVTQRWLDPRPTWTSPACSSNYYVTPPVDGFFSPVTYCGAFNRTAADFWIQGWTALSQNHMTANLLSINPGVMEGVSTGSSGVDLQLLVRMPIADGSLVTSDSRFAIQIDGGRNLAANFVGWPGLTNIQLPAYGGIVYKLPAFGLSNIGVGYHAFTATFPMSNGMVLSDTAYFHVIQ